MSLRVTLSVTVCVACLLVMVLTTPGCSGSTPTEDDGQSSSDDIGDQGADDSSSTDDGTVGTDSGSDGVDDSNADDGGPTTDGEPGTDGISGPPDPPPGSAPTITSDASIAELVEGLRFSASRKAAREALIKRGADAIPPLVAALDNEDPFVRAAAAFALAQIGDKSVLAQLNKRLETEKADVAESAIRNAIDALEES